MPQSVERGLPLVLVLDGDVGKTLGDILKEELGVARRRRCRSTACSSRSSITSTSASVEPADVVPVVIKSLLFAGSHDHHLDDERVSS